jgi:hypothetical protein
VEVENGEEFKPVRIAGMPPAPNQDFPVGSFGRI